MENSVIEPTLVNTEVVNTGYVMLSTPETDSDRGFYVAGRYYPSYNAFSAATQFAAEIYYHLGLGTLDDPNQAEALGRAILHTAMNAALKMSKGE